MLTIILRDAGKEIYGKTAPVEYNMENWEGGYFLAQTVLIDKVSRENPRRPAEGMSRLLQPYVRALI